MHCRTYRLHREGDVVPAHGRLPAQQPPPGALLPVDEQLALRHLRVEETDESIIISGRVSSYYLKQLAQETIMPVRGSLLLINQVLVAKEA